MMVRPPNVIRALAVALTLFFVASPPASTRAEPPPVFHDPLGRFSFAIPPGWTTQPASFPDVAIQFVADARRATGNVATEPIPVAMTLDEYVSVTTAAILRAHPDFQMSAGAIEETFLGGLPARCWQLTETSSAERLVITQYAVLTDATAYVLTFVCPEADIASFRDQVALIVATFTFSDHFPLV